MSNYNILKTNIAAQIKQNGAKAITGQILQTHLLSMITSLGAGYQYMGVAALNTNPGTPDYKCFYIATAVGTYSNFGSPALTVAQGEVAIFYYDTAWHKAVTGAASKADVDALIQTLEGEVSALGQKVFALADASLITPKFGITQETKSLGTLNWTHFCEPYDVVGAKTYRVRVHLDKASSANANIYYYYSSSYSTNLGTLTAGQTDFQADFTATGDAEDGWVNINAAVASFSGIACKVEIIDLQAFDILSALTANVNSLQNSIGSISGKLSETKNRTTGFQHFLEPLTLVKGTKYKVTVTSTGTTGAQNVVKVFIYYSLSDILELGAWTTETSGTYEFIANKNATTAWVSVYSTDTWTQFRVDLEWNAISEMEDRIPAVAAMSGKEFVILGDSSMTSDKWPGLFADLCNLVGATCINGAIGGSTWNSQQNPLYQFNQVKSSLQTDTPVLLIGCGTGTDTDIVSYDNVLQKCYADVSGETDGIERAINSIKTILSEYPKAIVFLQNNWITSAGGTYAGIQIRNLRRDFYLALCDYFGFALVDIARGGNIHEYTEDYTEDNGATHPKRWATSDGVHITTDAGKARVFSVWLGNIVSILSNYTR